ncbi:hypothetical protein EJ03DRAFT_325233 [Teratosphaeria nubilosa]|uniref:Uncharacterized protein n=1 Tax=Teratosphaeria nubilosa TaxID=161662 RepID=A0A6G1LGC6_9PEZI|nr:hypothetical protein EJ03DRAFT_325233 [Teratosphaeria nubilosa]
MKVVMLALSLFASLIQAGANEPSGGSCNNLSNSREVPYGRCFNKDNPSDPIMQPCKQANPCQSSDGYCSFDYTSGYASCT